VGIVPRSIWKKIGKEGFLCTGVPEQYGGAGADFLYAVIIPDNHYGTSSYPPPRPTNPPKTPEMKPVKKLIT